MENTFGKNLKQARISANMNQETLAKLISKSIPTVRKYENGERTPPISVVKEICTVLRVDSSELLGTESNNTNSAQDDTSVIFEQLKLIINSVCKFYNKKNTLSDSDIEGLQETLSSQILLLLKVKS